MSSTSDVLLGRLIAGGKDDEPWALYVLAAALVGRQALELLLVKFWAQHAMPLCDVSMRAQVIGLERLLGLWAGSRGTPRATG